MSEHPHFNVLAECRNGYIGVCECCHEYNFVYKNLFLIFSQDELIRFCEWVLSYRAHENTYLPLPHGRTRVYKSHLGNLYIAFRDDELDEVDELKCKRTRDVSS